MEQDTLNEITKKRKTNESTNVSYYTHGNNFNRKYSNGINKNHSWQFNQQSYRPNKNDYFLPSSNFPNLTYINKNSYVAQTASYGNNKRNLNDNSNSNSNRNCNNRGPQYLTHPFINKIPEDHCRLDCIISEKKNNVNIPTKIFIKESLKNTYAYVTDKKKNTKHQYNKVGLSSNEYTDYNVTTGNCTSYEHAKKLNSMWNIYVNELLDLTKTEELPIDTINDMELNGAEIEIHKSRCSPYVGIKGIIILETQNAFKIVTPKNRVLILLKNKTVFIVNIKDKQYYLHGVQLLRDPALKATKKYKMLQNRAI
ncbi:ribonuclease P protein subunit p29 [Plasmodium gonderi]|uniref:Ribonuclease P protein subunit p29 n=1 Tax=Plasmodium gonderi TaxID=77519 RepID=A0A1Y1JLQ5_PLAGO|nr:ribonuclease P protein subunit p29 [Plasmodium gonderi]GAW81752.1 ribonuclease P protein subunit p29 [Plasmodium gonderi]